MNVPAGVTYAVHGNKTVCFPNPTTGLLQILTAGGLPEAAYEVVSLEGRALLTGNLHEKTAVLDLSGWSAGTCFLRTGGNISDWSSIDTGPIKNTFSICNFITLACQDFMKVIESCSNHT